MRIDPFLTFTWLLLMVLLSLVLYALPALSVLLLASMLPVVFTGTKKWLVYMKFSLFSAAFIFIFNILLLGLNALEFTVMMILKFFIITSAFAVFSSVSEFEEIIEIMERLKMPQTATASIAIAMRFFPLVTQNARELEEAMLAKGIHTKGRGMRERIRARLPLLSSLLLISLERSIIAAEALEVRGFPSSKRRAWRRKNMEKREIVALSVILLGFFIALAYVVLNSKILQLAILIVPFSVLLGVRR